MNSLRSFPTNSAICTSNTMPACLCAKFGFRRFWAHQFVPIQLKICLWATATEQRNCMGILCNEELCLFISPATELEYPNLLSTKRGQRWHHQSKFTRGAKEWR